MRTEEGDGAHKRKANRQQAARRTKRVGRRKEDKKKTEKAAGQKKPCFFLRKSINSFSGGNKRGKSTGAKGMKKYCILFVLLFIIILTAAVCAEGGTDETSAYLRMHVRANSNSAQDQAIKYEVKEAIVEYLMPLAASCESKEEAIGALEASLSEIEKVADEVLAENGFSYTSHAEMRREEFPSRVYDGVTLEAGVYDALIVELGTGTGDNWWCVVYPPLCFSGSATGESIRYRSRILEIIENFFSD